MPVGSLFDPIFGGLLSPEQLSQVQLPPNVPARLRAMVSHIRMFMKDHPELNRLTSGEAHNDREIASAIIDSIDSWNQAAPRLVGDWRSLTNPPPWIWLKKRTIVELLESDSLFEARNYLSFTDGGTGITVNDKVALYMSIRNQLKSDCDAMLTAYKIQANIEGATGQGLESEYTLISGFYGVYA